MKITAMLADHVEEANGKLYINGGGWNVWWSPTAPFAAPILGLAVTISVPYAATNQKHRFALSVLDEDGNVVPLPSNADQDEADPPTKIEGEFTLGRPPHLPAGDEQIIPIAINLSGLVLPRFGPYSFVVEIDGSEEERIPFRLASPPGLHLT